MAKKRDYSTWSKEDLVREVEALRKQKTYGLIWERDKTKENIDYFVNWDGEKTKEVFSPETQHRFPVLKEVKEKEIVMNKDADHNILIEGDNYHSLAVLNFTHSKSIDVIYIDPPYNTGNRDFKYNDQWIDREDAYRHSKWLSFMEKRLKLAKNILKDDGIIFISIDDNEFAQLRILCDEIFNENNFIGCLVWQKKVTPANDSKFFSGDHEYVLVYARKKTPGIIKRLNRTEEQKKYYRNPDNDPKGPWNSIAATCNKSYKERPNLYYPIDNPHTRKKIWPKKTAVWSQSKDRFLELVKEKRIYWGKDGKSESPRIKLYLTEAEDVVPRSILFYKDVGHTQTATTEFRKIFPKGGFDYPKPASLIKYLLTLCNKSDTIVDFMAGSGTTGHAVLELNKEDGGNRHFILCTNNENNICTDICYPRIEKIIRGYKSSTGEKVEGLGGNLKYFKTDFVEAEPTDRNKKKLTDKATEILCLKEGTFEPVIQKKDFGVFKGNNHYTGIIFDSDAISDFKKAIKEIKGKFHVYVFSLGDDTYEEEFEDVKQEIELSPIPESILRVYRRIFQ